MKPALALAALLANAQLTAADTLTLRPEDQARLDRFASTAGTALLAAFAQAAPKSPLTKHWQGTGNAARSNWAARQVWSPTRPLTARSLFSATATRLKNTQARNAPKAPSPSTTAKPSTQASASPPTNPRPPTQTCRRSFNQTANSKPTWHFSNASAPPARA